MSSPNASTRRDMADRLHSVAIHLLRRVRRVDEETGLSAARLSALSVLVFGGPTTLGRLASAEQVSAPTMSRLVSGLERDGLAVREGDRADGRVVRVRATATGRRTLEQGRARRVAQLERLLETLEAPELETLDAAVGTLERALALASSAGTAYPAPTAERRWSDLNDDSSGSGGTSG
ncbi:MAG TPA: MarR family transcriptional regulator [Gaiellaceae bacterium]|nr:MarR family transcriptional regulator [Gaiellaceae bacterium]